MLSYSEDLIIGKKVLMFGDFSMDVCCVNAALFDLEWNWFLKSRDSAMNKMLNKNFIPMKC